MIKYLRRTARGATGESLYATIKYLRRSTNAGAGYGLSTTITPLVV